ncbi:glycosyltransferase family 2 protein [Cetobacterium somerae]|uniref:glycosyltransferase family 2 protein n=1 Tax=Cetobacterium somerae TaxID=188913 RepID=UPI00211F462C|nr:glycosyltransferase family 2 protein [Cetobacterium somerae]MCQ9628115.1 glycosyltransferase family 2 protein [Cetobacterium somerae]
MNSEWIVPNYSVIEIENKQTKYCLCIPVINEGKKIKAQLERAKKHGIDKIADIIICDGGSTDGSLNVSFLKEMGVSVLLIKKDKGKLSAQLRMGYSYALNRGYEGIVTVDGNGKDNIEAVPRFIEELEKGYDMIQGSRYLPGGKAINTPKIRHIAVKLLHVPIISLAAGFKYTDTTNGYRGYSKKYLLDEKVQPFREIFDTYELLAYLSVRAPQLGLKTKEIPVERVYPAKGKVPTKISFFKGNYILLKILWETLTKQYNPR